MSARTSQENIEIDLHGYHPDDILALDHSHVAKMIRQAWEMGAGSIRFIHGHGRNRGISPGFVNTNTGYFGLRLRSELRHDTELRQWIKHTTLDRSHEGSTAVKLKHNPNPSRTEFDDIFPQSSVPERRGWR
jgi:Smr domain